MSQPIGPGDYVECIQNRLATTLPPRGLVVGRVYRVEAVGVTPPHDVEPNVPWVRLSEIPDNPAKWGFRAAWFKPVYRPSGDLLTELTQPGLPDPEDMTWGEIAAEPRERANAASKAPEIEGEHQ